MVATGRVIKGAGREGVLEDTSVMVGGVSACVGGASGIGSPIGEKIISGTAGLSRRGAGAPPRGLEVRFSYRCPVANAGAVCPVSWPKRGR